MFGENIKQLRKDKELSQDELGKIFNISGPAVSKWETGQTEPDNKTLKMIANFFGVTTDYLLGNEIQANKINDAIKEKDVLKRLLIKNGYMKENEDLSDEEFEKLMKFIVSNKDLLRGGDKNA